MPFGPIRLRSRAARAISAAAFCALWTAAVAAQEPIRFEDRASQADLDFRHETGAGGQRYMVETMGSGLAAADLDVDGRLDLYWAQGSPTPGADLGGTPVNRIDRGNGDGTFTQVPGAASTAWSMGVVVADYDNDGFPDIYVSNLGPNQLYATTATAPGPRSGHRPAWRTTHGAHLPHGPTSISTAISTCTSPTTSTSRGRTTSSAATPSATCAPTAIRTSTTRWPTPSTATTGMAPSPTSPRRLV